MEPTSRAKRPWDMQRLVAPALVALTAAGCIGSGSTGTLMTGEMAWGSSSPVVHRVTVTPQHPRTLPVTRLALPLTISCHTGGLSFGHGIGFHQKITTSLSAGTHSWGGSLNGATITVNVGRSGVVGMSC